MQGGIIIFTSCHPRFSIKYFARKSVIRAHTIFCPKERDSRTYQANFFYMQNTILLSIISLGSKLFRLTGNYFIWQEIISIWQEIISFGRNTFGLTVNYFLWQEFISFGRNLFPLAGNHLV